MKRFFSDLSSVLNLTVIVAGLGYFVDLFDITVYGVVRLSSLQDIGLTDPAELLSSGVLIYNMQMLGMMIGGVLWGVLADRKGRLSVLFASIILYSAANLANAFVTSVEAYALCRFLGGLGLAGELGAAVTLVAESLPVEKRGLGTTIVATLGMLGIIAAAFFGQLVPWRYAFATGGVLGLALLLTRIKISESKLFTERSRTRQGDLRLLLTKNRMVRFIACIAVGIPIYYTTGVLFTFAPELASGLGIEGPVSAGNAILFGSIGLTTGDLTSGLLSQFVRSRKRAVGLSLAAGLALLIAFCLGTRLTPEWLYGLCLLIGITVGYWAVLITMAAEQFGTNIRATVATTVPNFVRGSAMLATTSFAVLKMHLAVSMAALIVGAACFGIALVALTFLDETFSRDLDYEET